MIECAGYRVAAYDSALAFLAALARDGQLGPGCIVTDVRMPEMTGLELVDRLKQKGVAEPIIVITGHADVPMAIQAMKAGVTDFIEKPFADDAILSVIREALEKRTAEAKADAEGQGEPRSASPHCRSASAKSSTGWSKARPIRSSPSNSASASARSRSIAPTS